MILSRFKNSEDRWNQNSLGSIQKCRVLSSHDIFVLIDLDEELELFVLNTINSHDGALGEGEIGLATRVLQVVHSEVLDVVEVLLLTRLNTQVSESIQASWHVSCVFTVQVLFKGLFVL